MNRVTEDENWDTPLHLSVSKDVLDRLPGRIWMEALLQKVRKDAHEIVQLLLERRDIDVNKRNRAGNTALHEVNTHVFTSP